MDNPDRAILDYNKAINADPNYALYYYVRAIAFKEQGNSINMSDDFITALEKYENENKKSLTNEQLTEIDTELSAFPEDEAKFKTEQNAQGKKTITGYTGHRRTLKIPARIGDSVVTEIGEAAFKGKNLTSVTIANGILKIGESAFENNQLTNIAIPNSVREIGGSYFAINRLTNFVIPKSVQKIGVTPLKYRDMAVVIQSGTVTVNGKGDKGSFTAGATVTLSSYKMAKYETTYYLWKEVYDWAAKHGYSFANEGREGSEGGDNRVKAAERALRPVTEINWRDAIVWCNAYSEMSGLEPVYYEQDEKVLKKSSVSLVIDDTADRAVMKTEKNGYRLPAEVEWEYAARGGNKSRGYKFSGSNFIDEVSWYYENA
jgi:formylglycine-generating enzyme required for sulfatase activity